MMNCEILAPAGDERSAYAALGAGADAVYLGLTRFSARDGAENFDVSALERVVRYAHLLGAKVYVCLNTLVKDDETEAFFESAVEAWNAGADALLLQDPFLGKALKAIYPEVVLHLSTQAGCCNVYGARFAKECGFSRVVAARETPVKDVAQISQIIETEAFVQGALCTCFSGQCYLSSFAGNNSGNRGRCKQPCRKKYACDRKGYEDYAYALSLSDLSVGERIGELLEAGVCSFKIEGRMRRPEYVAAAVAYYRALLAGGNAKEEFSRLKRAYNRGGYTAGLAFGQDGKLLSRRVQGHVGEDVGEITLKGGRYFCKSKFAAQKGDGFKILRGGLEAGGAVFAESAENGFYLNSSARLLCGDRVCVTTDTAACAVSLQPVNKRAVNVELRLIAGEAPYARAGEFEYRGGETVQNARNSPLSEEELTRCFSRTDGLPFAVTVSAETQNAFMPKSSLNAFRREFYEKLTGYLAPRRAPLEKRRFPAVHLFAETGNETAVLSADLEGLSADVLVYKPLDYAKISAEETAKGTGEKFLYLPPYFTAEDEEVVAPALQLFDGVYCDGYYGVLFAKKYGKKLFAGTGFNLTNRYSVCAVAGMGVRFALSKELSSQEQRALAAVGSYALCAGSLKVMDLVYCPFEKTCGSCDRRELYRLKDEGGREFILRRYRISGSACRFELYNCAPVAAYNGKTSALISLSAKEDGDFVTYARTPQKIEGATRGHAERSML